MSGIFVIVFVLISLLYVESVSGLGTKTGTFQVLHKHPALKKCALNFLHKNEYVGLRVSEQTGECEGLPHDWGQDQTTESGYAFAKKLVVTETFEPQVPESELIWMIPGVLNSGAKLDVYVLQNEPNSEKIAAVNLHRNRIAEEIDVRITIFRDLITVIDGVDAQFESWEAPAKLSSEQAIFKFSLLAQTDSNVMLVEDKELFRINSDAVQMDTLRYLYYESGVYGSVLRLQFTGK